MPEVMNRPRIVAIVGPTAVGKSAIAERVACHLGGEIVSADSMQVYRGMDIGTAKTPLALRAVAYHCIDLVDPGAPFSAALYQTAAREAIAGIRARSRVPVFCGGTGLYLRAALDDWVFPPGDACSVQRRALEDDALRLGPAVLHARLADVDPRAASMIHVSNVRRVIRALEMAASGGSYAAQAARFETRTAIYETIFIGLTMQREALYQRIDERVDLMIADGLVAEVEKLIGLGYRDALSSSQAIGYKQLVPVVEGGGDLSEAVEAIKRATRRYAKRQLTWFRADRRIAWFDLTGIDDRTVTEELLALIESDVTATGVPAAGTWRLTST